MTDGGIEVPPLSRKAIRDIARRVRQVLGVTGPYFPIVKVLDVVLPKLDEEYSFEVWTKAEMGENHGLTIPEYKIIRIREDVYLGARQGKGRDRFTLAHELGHLLLHHGTQVGLARTIAPVELPAYRNSEWQANTFAGELLMCSDYLDDCRRSAELALKFGVTRDAAKVQWGVFKKDGLV